jgi:hypothetical protein
MAGTARTTAKPSGTAGWWNILRAARGKDTSTPKITTDDAEIKLPTTARSGCHSTILTIIVHDTVRRLTAGADLTTDRHLLGEDEDNAATPTGQASAGARIDARSAATAAAAKEEP